MGTRAVIPVDRLCVWLEQWIRSMRLIDRGEDRCIRGWEWDLGNERCGPERGGVGWGSLVGRMQFPISIHKSGVVVTWWRLDGHPYRYADTVRMSSPW